VYDIGGLDLESVHKFKDTHGTVVGSPGTTTIDNQELLRLECDILVPAAMENQIRADNARELRCRLVCEAANGPTTPAADDILREARIPVLPDIVANSGGVCVSYFEWVQNIENEQWDLDEVLGKLLKKMQRAVDAVVDRWEQMRDSVRSIDDSLRGEVDLRTAAMLVAIERVANVALERGIWP
jgi:glutamate dehydrogenase (NAD(P)+)